MIWERDEVADQEKIEGRGRGRGKGRREAKGRGRDYHIFPDTDNIKGNHIDGQ